MARKRIFVVDDEKNMQVVLKLLFDGEGYDTELRLGRGRGPRRPLP
jgi:CheY-like chemotaxis protein